MTVPPGGPYGQDPSGTNPYEQGPSWGGQPQGGPHQGGPYQGGPYQNPQGSQYQYPQGNPYAAGAYPNQQFPQAGQQFPPGWPPGPYSPGPPPNGPRSQMPWLIGIGIVVLAVIALVVVLVVNRDDGKSTEAAPSSSTTSAPSQSDDSEQNATDCTPNVSGGTKPTGDTVSAGKLSFPASAAPGWFLFSDDATPNAIGAVGVAQAVPGANQWAMQAEVAITNFAASMDVAAQASKLMACVADGPGYSASSPTLGPTKTSSVTVDGTEAARVDADVTIADTSRNVKGDSVIIISVKTEPVTFFYGGTPIGDADARATIEGIIAGLKVTKK